MERGRVLGASICPLPGPNRWELFKEHAGVSDSLDLPTPQIELLRIFQGA